MATLLEETRFYWLSAAAHGRRRNHEASISKAAAKRFRCTAAIAALLMLSITSPALEAQDVISIDPRDCQPGIHSQVQGPFALQVFCDDALGTNIAVFLSDLGAPLAGKYSLGDRFWQGEEWNLDVTAYAWLGGDRLLLSTSRVYGSGRVYLLDLAAQSWRVARPSNEDECVTHLEALRGDTVILKLTVCDDQRETRVEFSL